MLDMVKIHKNENEQRGDSIVVSATTESNEVERTEKNISTAIIANNATISKELEYNSKLNLRNYIAFKKSNVLLSNSKGALFCKSFENDDRVLELATLAKAGAKDEWADKPVFLTILKDNIPTQVPINVVDLALNGYEKYVDKSLVTDDLKEFGGSMKRWHGLCFKPLEDTTQKYNLFKGFPVSPVKGDIAPFLNLLELAVGKEEGEIILDYFAHLFQKPQEKPRYALIFKGTKGVGKNTVEEMLGKELLRNENYYRSSQKEQFFGKFNSHLQQNLLSVMQELVWDGSNNYDSILKDMITERSRAVEKKFVDQEMMDNYSRIIMTTNADWVVPASGKDERRYCVISFPAEKPQELGDNFFKELHEWYYNGGKENLMYEMLNRDISNFSINKAPETKGLAEQLAYSLDGIERFCADGLRNGYFGNLHKANTYNENYAYCYTNERMRVKRKELYESFKFNFKGAVLESQSVFHKKMGELLGCTMKKQSDGNYTQFLTIEESAKIFTNATAVKIELEHDTWDLDNKVSNQMDFMEDNVA
ncbi:MAG: DUF5906 domain-containing protein [Campylobacterota bacterium]|nr:DUF5906 domain-containing protein [Campylobacterota bacterium]